MEPIIYDMRMADGSRHFAALPQTGPAHRLRDDLAALPGAEVTGFVTDGVTESWIDVRFQGYHFSINDQYGEYWLFVDEVECPDAILRAFAMACQRALPPLDV
jgi:hypothetical protein